jgi:cell division protein FtsN
MYNNKPAMYSPKKNGGHRLLIIISVICLIIFAALILIYEEVEVERKSVDLSKPTKMRKISKPGDKKPVEVKEKEAIDEEEVEVVSIQTKKKEEPVEEPKEEPKEKSPAKLKSGYYLQVGAFANKNNYDAMNDKLSKLGYPISQKVTEKDMIVYRVIIGRFNSKKEADDASKEIKRLKYESNVHSIPGGKYEVSVETIFYESKANKINKKLNAAGLNSKIRKLKEKGNIYSLLVGPYSDEKSARKTQTELVQKRYKTYLMHE